MSDTGSTDEGWEAVMRTPVVFGLRAQGHIPTIERMLAEGASWPEIGDAIGWCPDTAREWFKRDQEANS
jgi:hypothetical protein